VFEIEDQPWCPATIRDLATDYLHFVQTAVSLHRTITPLVRETLEASGTTHIVDLCSGGSGPLPAVIADLGRSGIDATATLTDLFPNISAFQRVANGSNGTIGYVHAPVDARAVPRDLTGLRTLFNGFHHFTPEDARAILRDAADAGQPIAIFEASRRTFKTILPALLLLPLFVWFATPFMRPFLWKRLLFTYPLPCVPLICLWDGVVSQLRAYTPEELRALGEPSGNKMCWRAGYEPLTTGPGLLTYLIGWPAPTAAVEGTGNPK
jgi:hypothetical protein